MSGPERRMLTEEEGFALLEAVRRGVPQEPDTAVRSLEQWAALRAWFQGDELDEAARRMSPERLWEVQGAILDRCEIVTVEGATRAYMLSDSDRRRILRQLWEEGMIENGLPRQASDEPLPALFARYLSFDGPRIDSLDDDELGAAARIAAWLYPFYPGAPDPDRVRSRIEHRALLAPFQRLVGDHFRGREDVLRELRIYLDVLPSHSGFESLQRGFNRIAESFVDDKPLWLHGPGGVGKSSVIAKFVLDHVQGTKGVRELYFAYLDFDRPGLRADEPWTLLFEIARQLEIQIDEPDVRDQLARLRRVWSARTREPSRGRTELSGEYVEQQYVDQLAYVLRGVLGWKKRPAFLLVLDTVEEAAYRADEELERIFEMLAALHQQLPRLRLVIAGRHTPPSLPHRAVPIGAFDEPAALAFVGHLLDRNQIPHGDLPKQIYKAFGGNPLNLWLVVDVLRAEGADALSDVKRSTRRHVFLRAEDAVVQGHLYQRILGHVHDLDVRHLAHPGLTLRRISPRIIAEVLAKPCGLGAIDDARAHELFARLAREVALVERVIGPSGEPVLVHRSDVRRVMLAEMRRENRSLVKNLHRMAVKFYARETGLDARAEELYHRLCLGQTASTLDARWMQGVEGRLGGALEELQGRARVYLAARLGAHLDETELQAADLETWELATKARVERLLAEGLDLMALARLRQREERSARSPLPFLEAKVLIRLGRYEDALRALATAADEWPPDPEAEAVVLLAKLRAEALYALGRDRDAASALDDGVSALAPHEVAALIELELARIAIGAMHDLHRLAELARSPAARVVYKNPELARALAAILGSWDEVVLDRALRGAGLVVDPAQREELRRTLEQWDRELITSDRTSLKTELENDDLRTWLTKSSPEELGRTLARWLSAHAGTASAPRIREQVVGLFAFTPTWPIRSLEEPR